MKITLDVKEDKLMFFLELIRNFEFIKVDKSETSLLTQAHLDVLDERLSDYAAQPDNVITWEQIRASIEK
jgi:putative addiction module component (TIGR02574 family)